MSKPFDTLSPPQNKTDEKSSLEKSKEKLGVINEMLAASHMSNVSSTLSAMDFTKEMVKSAPSPINDEQTNDYQERTNITEIVQTGDKIFSTKETIKK